ncbi:unnamed protein product [Candida verbasci]|uniref:DNA ligase n=1 Tax=Candida verbasci TaxID=1227364 RepID=A0A9W4TUC3_9ASCO|nr:unnamed protein product [Candida verbasci]
MPLYKEENFLIINPGSRYTVFSFGLQDSLSPPQYKIPSIVYQDKSTKEFKSSGETDEEIYPIKDSKLVNIDAFNFLIKLILQSIIKNHPILTINQIPLLILFPSLTWSNQSIEYLTKYIFENLEFTAFNILDLSLASTFAIGQSTTSLVVNIGYNTTQIVPIVNYQTIKFASKILNIGGNSLNQEIKNNSPNLTDEQVENLKISGIYEVLNETDFNAYNNIETNDLDDEEMLDVSKIIDENKDETKKDEKPNKELEKNYFIDSKTNEKVYVGKERFLGCESLINEISKAVYKSLAQIPDIDKRQDCYDNLIFIGSTFKIPGFKEALLIKLNEDYLVQEPPTDDHKLNSNGINSTIMKYQKNDDINENQINDISQVPNSIKMVKYPDYFPEWKLPKEQGGSWEDLFFLGGEIFAKQIFSGTTHHHGKEVFVSSDMGNFSLLINNQFKSVRYRMAPKAQQTLGRFFGGNNPSLNSPLKRKATNNGTSQLDKSPLKKSKNEEPKIEESIANDSGSDLAKYDDSNGDITTKEAETLIQLNESKPIIQDNQTTRKQIPFNLLADTFERLEKEPGRLQKISILSQLYLRTIKESESYENLVRVVYLTINKLGPDYDNLELGLGETILIKAISECYGRSTTKVKEDYKKTGDLGLVAQQSRENQASMFSKPAPLQIDTVFNNLKEIAKSKGKDSQSKKIHLIKKMLTACDQNSQEAKFLIRSLEGKLRIGLAGQTVTVSLAQAFVSYEQNSNLKIPTDKLTKAEELFKEAYTRTPNYEICIKAAFEGGIFNILDTVKITPGVPLKPMLAKPTKSVGEVLDKFANENFTCEYKYDGERAQVHLCNDGAVKVFSRNGEDMSERYPDIITIISNLHKTQEHKSMILDCEAVAWDKNLKRILPFQTLSTRKRKDVNEKDITVHICLFVFDLLYYNEEPLLTKTLTERRQYMQKHIHPLEGQLQFATCRDSTSESKSSDEIIHEFLLQSIKDYCEGLMVKVLDGHESHYEPSKRSQFWLKLKKDYLDGQGDSLDLVVIGAYNGKGKRTGTYGGFLLASYNEDTGDLETTCKIGTGFSDEMLSNLYTKLHPTEIQQPKNYFVYDTNNSNAKPDVWFDPSLIFEVKTADLSLSPIYKAAHQQYGKGISLRFPRFVRIRDDKNIEDATSSTQVSEFFENQAMNK